MSNVTLVCTTDDPVDTLEWHQKIKADESFDVQVLPAWRPEKAMGINKPGFVDYLGKLSQVSGVEVTSFASLIEALRVRLDYFHANGCTISDHSLDYVMYEPATAEEVEAKVRQNLLSMAATPKAAAKAAQRPVAVSADDFDDED